MQILEHWARLVQQLFDLLNYHVISEQSMMVVGVVGGFIVLSGLLVAFRSVGTVRLTLTALGLAGGGYAGTLLARQIDVPEPLAILVCGAVGAVVTAATYRFWLAGLTAAVFGSCVLAVQLGGDTIISMVEYQEPTVAPLVTLPSPDERTELVKREFESYLGSVKDRGTAEFQKMGTSEWILPGLATLVGLVLGFKAPRFFAGAWFGLSGAMTAVLAAALVAGRMNGDIQAQLRSNPNWLLYGVIGLWLIGMLTQIIRARRNARAVVEPVKLEAAIDA